MTWTHRICTDCWYKGESRVPTRIKDDSMGECCFCHRKTYAGIYVRHDPKDLNCEDNHKKKEG